MSKRVVVTGLGAITPIGNSVDEFWKSIQEAKSGVGPCTKVPNLDRYPSKVAGEVKNFDPKEYMDRKEARKMDFYAQLCVAGAAQAMNDAGFKDGELDPERFGVIIGNGIGGIQNMEESYLSLFEKGRIPVMVVPKMISNIGPGHIAIIHNAQGPCYSIVTACASGTDAISRSAEWIRSGKTDVIITGGAEAPVVEISVGGFSAIQALSTRYNDNPEVASRPFDKDRDGFVIGEGAGIIILEEYEHAKRRGAKIYAEYAGGAMTCDANHMTAPHPEGRGAAKAMQLALEDAGMKPEDIDYINAHGTSTPMNDPIETLAVKKAFGDHAYKLKVSSTKSMTAHLIGAAGGVEAIACIKAIENQFFPPTANLENPDIENGCDLDYVPKKGVNGTIRAALSNSLGFGGHNGTIIFKQISD
jgi:3-oxoacyl-[acyl-carrier-protein] synthase II